MVELELSEWLKPEDVSPEAELVFTDSGKSVTIPIGDGKLDKNAFEITVKFKNGATRSWTMNMTSQRAVAVAYGKNTENWVNKPVIAFVTSQNVRGVMKDVIYARIPKGSETP